MPLADNSVVRGLIPAHAGKTSTRGLSNAAMRAHPHSRGENRDSFLRESSFHGSSPLTRGKQPAASGRMGASGLIPAHAGKTSSASCPSS